MRLAPRALVALSLLAGCAHGSPEPATTTPRAEEASETAPSSTCEVAVDREEHASAVRDTERGFGLILPGDDWEIDCDPAPAQGVETYLFGRSSSLALIVSVNPFGRDRGLDETRELEGLVERIREGSESGGLAIEHVELAEERINDDVERMVLSYEVTGAPLDREQARSIHAWTLLWMPDERILSMHLSWTGPSDHYRDEFVDALRTMVIPFGAL